MARNGECLVSIVDLEAVIVIGAAVPSVVVNSGLLIFLPLFLVNGKTDAFVRRRALHRYDPPDLVTNFNDRTSDSAATKTVTKDGSDDGKSNNVQRRQIEDAVAKGLLVDVSTPVKKTPDTTHMDDEDGIMESPVSVLSEESRRHDVFMDIGNENDVDLLDGDDSDDDLL